MISTSVRGRTRFQRSVTETKFTGYFNGNDGYQGPVEHRKFVWEEFVFPSHLLPFEKGRRGLYAYLSRQFKKISAEFDRQYEAWMRRHVPAPLVLTESGAKLYQRADPFTFDPGPLGLPGPIAFTYQLMGPPEIRRRQQYVRSRGIPLKNSLEIGRVLAMLKPRC